VFRSFVPGSEFRPLMPAEQFIGRRIEDVFPEELATLQQERLRAAFAGRRMQVFEYSVPGAGGARHYEARLVAIDETRALGIVRDVTERHEGEAHREALIDELEAKNAELERFTYTVSHDLKTPLITIAAFAGFLQRDAREGNQEQMTQDVGRVNEAVLRMKELLDDLLELSRIGRVIGESETVPFDQVAHDAVARLGSLPADAGVEIVVAPDLPSVTGDRRRLVEVIQNLLENAIHFRGDQPHPRIEVTTRSQDGELTLLIRDNGIGIDPRYHQRVFTLFEKLDPSSQGTGIGLAIVKRIVEVHGGQIWVESAGEGAGSTFCLALPLAHPGHLRP
jgi:two-component system sensor kinase FixL